MRKVKELELEIKELKEGNNYNHKQILAMIEEIYNEIEIERQKRKQDNQEFLSKVNYFEKEVIADFRKEIELSLDYHWIAEQGKLSKSLKDTVDNMLSEDYKKRFIAEIEQLEIRYIKLKNVIQDYSKNNYNCPLKTLESQLKYMGLYLSVLYERLDIEKIKYKKKLIKSNKDFWQESSSNNQKEELEMEVQNQAARDKPSVSRVELFDSLMTISSMTKDLAKKVLCSSRDKSKEGGKNDALSKRIFNLL